MPMATWLWLNHIGMLHCRVQIEFFLMFDHQYYRAFARYFHQIMCHIFQVVTTTKTACIPVARTVDVAMRCVWHISMFPACFSGYRSESFISTAQGCGGGNGHSALTLSRVVMQFSCTSPQQMAVVEFTQREEISDSLGGATHPHQNPCFYRHFGSLVWTGHIIGV